MAVSRRDRPHGTDRRPTVAGTSDTERAPLGLCLGKWARRPNQRYNRGIEVVS